MQYDGIDLVCPACRGELEGVIDFTGSLRCSACGREYPVTVGIPDLRLWSDPYIGMEADRAKGVMLHEACSRLSFAESVRYYYSVTEAVPPFQARRFERSLLAAEGRARESLAEFEAAAAARDGGESVLDLGCGTAPMLAVAAPRFRRAIGVDIAFRWLVLARRRLEELGVKAPLVCACAEALPFRNGWFDRVIAESALEHFRDGDQALSEVNRVIARGGWFFMSTPNRFSPGPDPHTGLPLGSFLPNAVTAAYVRRKRGVPPKRTLYSRSTLRRLLTRGGFTATVFAPEISRSMRQGLSAGARGVAVAYNTARGTALGRMLLTSIGPLLYCTASKVSDVGSSAASKPHQLDANESDHRTTPIPRS